MKKLQMLTASVALTLLLSTFTFADDGIIETGKTPPPPPPASSTTETAPSDTGGIIEVGAPTDGIMETGAPAAETVASALLQGMLALF